MTATIFLQMEACVKECVCKTEMQNSEDFVNISLQKETHYGWHVEEHDYIKHK
jgi:hypothetical protein